MNVWKPLSAAAVLAAALSIPLLAQQAPTFRAGTQVVSIFATVTDTQKRLVPDLTKDDFQGFDKEKAQPGIYFDKSVPPIHVVVMLDNSVRPINVVVMLDTSGSMTLTIDLLKQAAEQFLLRLLPEDKGRVGAFNAKIQFNAKWSNDRDQMVTDAKSLDFGSGSRLWDAVVASLDELKTIDGRKVILL